jgi:hypothetical protein
VKEFHQTFETYLFCEQSDPNAIESVLKGNSSNLNFDFFTYKKKLGENYALAENLMPVDDSGERLKHFEMIFSRTSKYLNVLAIFLNSKIFLAEMADHEEIMLSLIKLLASKSPYLSVQAS